MSPYAHPIIPLMLDMNSAREAMPGSPPAGDHRISRWRGTGALAPAQRRGDF